VSLRAYQERPTHPRPPAPIYLPEGSTCRSPAEELEALYLSLPPWLPPGERWGAWRYAWDPQRADWGKIPLDCLSPGRFARSTDPRTWASLADAVRFRQRFGADGLVRALVDGEELVAIDLDHVRDPVSGELTALARDTLAELPGVYTEISPSGGGLHLWLRQPFPEAGRQGRRRGQIEVYAGSRFVAVTGRVVRRGR
jgi:primase-polymerase (primpol)-like protein